MPARNKINNCWVILLYTRYTVLGALRVRFHLIPIATLQMACVCPYFID